MDELKKETTNVTVDLPGVTEGEVAEVTEEKMIESMQNDLDGLNKRLEQVALERKNYNDQFELDKQIWDILQKPGSMKMLIPAHEFQKDPKYWELQERKQAFAIREDCNKGTGTLKGYDMQTEELKTRLKSTKLKLKSIKDNMGDKKDE